MSYGRVAASRQAAEATRKRRAVASAGIGSADSPPALIRAGRVDRAACDDGRLAIVAGRVIDGAAIRLPSVATPRLTGRARQLLHNYGSLATFSSCAVAKKGRSAMRRGRGGDVEVIDRSDALCREKPLVTPRGSLYYPRRYQGKGTAAAATMLSGVAGA